VMGEGVGGVVGGAEALDLEAVEDTPGGEVGGGELRVGLLPDGLGGGGGEELVDAEVALQFEVGPVIEGVAEGIGNRASPGEELFLGRGGAGNGLLFDAVGPHGAPFVVVALEPDLEKVGELAIGGHVLGRQVAMVVEDGLRLGVVVIEAGGGFGGQEEVFVDKGHGRKVRFHRATDEILPQG